VEMSEAKDGRGCEKLRNEATRSFVFSKNMKKGCSRRRIASFAISFSTASAVAHAAAYELSIAFCFLCLLFRAMNSSSCAQVFAVPDVDLTASLSGAAYRSPSLCTPSAQRRHGQGGADCRLEL
jgi:hypothetical protein